MSDEGDDCVRQAFKDAGAKHQDIPAPVKLKDLERVANARGWKPVPPQDVKWDNAGIVVHDTTLVPSEKDKQYHAEHSSPVRVLAEELGIIGISIVTILQRDPKAKKKK